MGGGRTSLQPVTGPDVTWQPKLHTLASGMRELGCHSSSSSPSTSTARRPAVPAPARQYPNLPDAHAHVERRHHITMRGSTTNDYSDWHQHTSAERQLNFFAADLDQSATADDGPPAAYPHLLDAICCSLYYGTTDRRSSRHHRHAPCCTRCVFAAGWRHGSGRLVRF